jgi:hypothetical protein
LITTPITTGEQACALVDEHGVVMLASHLTLPSLVTAIAGEHVRGSWWSHAHGTAIFNIASALEDYALVCKLVEGKVTFVAPRLVPAFLTIVNDTSFRAAKIARLDDDARALLARVDKGEVRGAEKKAREALEKTLLARSRQVHTSSGKHETVLTRWAESPGLPLAAAHEAFAVACRGAKSAF